MLDFRQLTRNLNPDDIQEVVEMANNNFFMGVPLDKVLGEFNDYGFRIENGGSVDDKLDLYFKDRILASFP